MKSILVFAGLAALTLTACSPSDGTTHTHHDVVALAAKAKGEVHVIGTLATLGSFEWDAAPLKTHAAAELLHIPQMLHDHQLTAADAQAKLDAIDAAHDLIEQALTVCHQDDSTGHCRGSTAKAQALLNQARQAMSAVDQDMINRGLNP
jgi:hypothetical protein